MFRLCCNLLLSILIVSCQATPTKPMDCAQSASDPLTKPVTQPTTTQTTNTVPASTDASQSSEVAPSEAEPKGKHTDEDGEQCWKRFREMYISRYLKYPEYLVWAIKQPVPKKIAEFLEWGYGVLWNPNSEVPKDLETILLQARLKDEQEMSEAMNGLAQQGKGGPQYLLGVYIVSWYYCMTGKNDKAKALVDEATLFQSVVERGIPIPKAHLDSLQAATRYQN